MLVMLTMPVWKSDFEVGEEENTPSPFSRWVLDRDVRGRDDIGVFLQPCVTGFKYGFCVYRAAHSLGLSQTKKAKNIPSGYRLIELVSRYYPFMLQLAISDKCTIVEPYEVRFTRTLLLP